MTNSFASRDGRRIIVPPDAVAAYLARRQPAAARRVLLPDIDEAKMNRNLPLGGSSRER